LKRIFHEAERLAQPIIIDHLKAPSFFETRGTGYKREQQWQLDQEKRGFKLLVTQNRTGQRALLAAVRTARRVASKT
jgi:hypothetical protein